jgi:hypothetical protein
LIFANYKNILPFTLFLVTKVAKSSTPKTPTEAGMPTAIAEMEIRSQFYCRLMVFI